MHPPADDNDTEADNNQRRCRHELAELRRSPELGLTVSAGKMSVENCTKLVDECLESIESHGHSVLDMYLTGAHVRSYHVDIVPLSTQAAWTWTCQLATRGARQKKLQPPSQKKQRTSQPKSQQRSQRKSQQRSQPRSQQKSRQRSQQKSQQRSQRRSQQKSRRRSQRRLRDATRSWPWGHSHASSSMIDLG